MVKKYIRVNSAIPKHIKPKVDKLIAAVNAKMLNAANEDWKDKDNKPIADKDKRKYAWRDVTGKEKISTKPKTLHKTGGNG